jgi:hypothetical protein
LITSSWQKRLRILLDGYIVFPVPAFSEPLALGPFRSAVLILVGIVVEIVVHFQENRCRAATCPSPSIRFQIIVTYYIIMDTMITMSVTLEA